MNRAPANLLEVILVDDASTKGIPSFIFSPAKFINEPPYIVVNDLFISTEHSKKPLDDYVTQHMPRVRVIHLAERSGLIRARMAGARRAKGDVIIFLDSHSEANVNWLPPLLGNRPITPSPTPPYCELMDRFLDIDLDPIAEDYRTVVCPFIDVIDFETFAYR